MKLILSISLLFFFICLNSLHWKAEKFMFSKKNDDKVIDTLPYKIVTFSINNDNESNLGYEGIDAYTFGAMSMCFLDENQLLVVDTYHHNLKMINLTNTDRFGEIRVLDNVLPIDFTPYECVFYKGKLFVTSDRKNEFLISDKDLKKTIFHSFTSEIVNLSTPLQFSLYNDSLYISCSYEEKNSDIERYDIYNILSNTFYRDNREFYDLLSANAYSFHGISNDLKKFKDLNKYLNYVTAYTSLYGGNKKAILTIDEKEGLYNLIVW